MNRYLEFVGLVAALLVGGVVGSVLTFAFTERCGIQ